MRQRDRRADTASWGGAMPGLRHRLHATFVVPLQSDRRHLDVLTGIRGWAALWVFLYHVWSLSGHPDFSVAVAGITVDFTPLVAMGGAGVTIFFVLSGFLLASPFAEWRAGRRERPRLGRYFLRRVMRVFPAYYAQLALLVLVAWWGSGQVLIQDAGAWVRHLLMLFMPPPLGVEPSINLVWWTLPIEFGFYLVLPLLAFMLTPRQVLWLLLGCLAAMYVWRHGVAVSLADAPLQMRVHAAYQLPGSMDSFGMGMLAAVLHANRARLPRWLLPPEGSRALGLLGIALVVAAVYWLSGRRDEYWSDNLIFYAWTPALSLGIAGVLLAGAGGAGVLRRLFGNRYMVFFGLASYSYYLWHLPLLRWIVASEWFQAIESARFVWLLAISTPLVVVVAALSYVLVEVPGMRFHRRSGRAQA